MYVNERPFSTIAIVLSTAGVVQFAIASWWLEAALCVVVLFLAVLCHWRPRR